MNFFPIRDPQSTVQLVMFILCFIMGLSHVIRPRMWADFFQKLADRGTSGLILHSFISLGPAVMVVVLHEVWSGPALVVTVYGWLLLIKACIGFLLPGLGMRSLEMSRHGTRGFVVAGVGMLAVAAFSAAALWH